MSLQAPGVDQKDECIEKESIDTKIKEVRMIRKDHETLTSDPAMSILAEAEGREIAYGQRRCTHY